MGSLLEWRWFGRHGGRKPCMESIVMFRNTVFIIKVMGSNWQI